MPCGGAARSVRDNEQNAGGFILPGDAVAVGSSGSEASGPEPDSSGMESGLCHSLTLCSLSSSPSFFLSIGLMSGLNKKDSRQCLLYHVVHR